MAKRKKQKVGSGKRFKSLVGKLRRKKGRTRTGKSRKVRSPKALAAWIGRRKYGKKRFQKMAAAGRKRKRRKK